MLHSWYSNWKITAHRKSLGLHVTAIPFFFNRIDDWFEVSLEKIEFGYNLVAAYMQMNEYTKEQEPLANPKDRQSRITNVQFHEP